MSPTKPRRYATLAQAAELLGSTERFLRDQISAGVIRGYRMGKRAIRVDLNEIEDKLLTPIPTVTTTTTTRGPDDHR